MTRNQYNEFLYIKSLVKEVKDGEKSPYAFYIKTWYCDEFKKKANDLLESIGYFPIRVGYISFDKSHTMGINLIYVHLGTSEDWRDCTLQSEREEICKAINA